MNIAKLTSREQPAYMNTILKISWRSPIVSIILTL